MEQKVIKVGNSLGIIIPQKVLNTVGIKQGDTVIVKDDNKNISISPVKTLAGGVDVHFMKVVDEFIEEHKDVLQELSQR